MYAIISDGSHQYRVEEGQEVLIHYRDVPAGEKITFDRVLAVGGEGDAKLGSPLRERRERGGRSLGPEKGEKLVIQKMRRRKNFRQQNRRAACLHARADWEDQRVSLFDRGAIASSGD